MLHRLEEVSTSGISIHQFTSRDRIHLDETDDNEAVDV